jgi:hypothetical protein
MTTKMFYTATILCICLISMLVAPVYALSNETSVFNGTSFENKTYGGIPGNVSQPPEGTQINLLLSRYYQLPVATSKEATFWYGLSYWNVGGYWFTAEELMKLPYEYIKNNRSPYYGGITNDDDMQHVPVPVSCITLAGFACFAIVLNKKR